MITPFFYRRNRKGQAIVEVVLLFPVFMIVAFFIVKIFALLAVVQKMEVASFYAARRWQLEGHRAARFETWDAGTLLPDIQRRVNSYLGLDSPTTKKFLNISSCQLTVRRTTYWNIMTLNTQLLPSKVKLLCKMPREVVCAKWGIACEKGYSFMCTFGGNVKVIRYIAPRDRPIGFELPGLKK